MIRGPCLTFVSAVKPFLWYLGKNTFLCSTIKLTCSTMLGIFHVYLQKKWSIFQKHAWMPWKTFFSLNCFFKRNTESFCCSSMFKWLKHPSCFCNMNIFISLTLRFPRNLMTSGISWRHTFRVSWEIQLSNSTLNQEADSREEIFLLLL